jgi:hypothetical protein
MNLSSRWCVTAVVAVGALGCSDPVPPPAQGAFIARINSVSPAPAGKMCPAGAAFTYDVPAVDPKLIPPKTLDADTYAFKIIDGEDSSTVSCSITGGSTFTFSGRISLGGQAIEVSNGMLGADKKGTALITVTNTAHLSSSLAARAENPCTVNAAAAADNNFQVRAGSMWASFNCPAVEHQPTDYCKAEGFFVFENCRQ